MEKTEGTKLKEMRKRDNRSEKTSLVPQNQ